MAGTQQETNDLLDEILGEQLQQKLVHIGEDALGHLSFLYGGRGIPPHILNQIVLEKFWWDTKKN